MNLNSYGQLWVITSILMSGVVRTFAQCNPPSNFTLTPPQTSTSLSFQWASSAGANQYQLRYWETNAPDDKTIVDNFGSSPGILRGLRKSTAYTIQIRSKCGNSTSDWSSSLAATTLNSSGTCSVFPSGVTVSTTANTITLKWSSTNSHTIRYRTGTSGDWLIPAGGMTVTANTFTITGIGAGSYQVEVRRNCSATAGNFLRLTVDIAGQCPTPVPPVVVAQTTTAMINLPAIAGVQGYNVDYRMGNSGAWTNTGMNIPPSLYLLNPPLSPQSSYQVRIQAVCAFGLSEYSTSADFSTIGQASCLQEKDFGKNLNASEIALIDQQYNSPSPFAFGSMIGVNDGGLVFRSFYNTNYNQITQLTRQFRNFHTMDEDFNAVLNSYDLNIKPKNTLPEGTPAHTDRNKAFYEAYRLNHGFGEITAATEILQYSPQSWKEKIYKESDWSMSGPAGIRQSYANYTSSIIKEFAPPQGTEAQILISNYQIGNELWDYPVKSDYHNLVSGAHDAFVGHYGLKKNGGWRMRLIAGAFQAFRDNSCDSFLRDYSNCGGDLLRHDFIGDYLDLQDCAILIDLDAIDCHPYSFLPGSNAWTYPENPLSETWQIRNLAGWLMMNRNVTTGVLRDAKLWSTEYGFDSNPNSGVGEKTQSAYLLRGILMHSRYHYEKIFLYNAFDVVRPNDIYYKGLYNSAGLWRLGTHPLNNAWPSPLEAHGATPKPAWYGLLDLKSRFGNHVFYKALVEDAQAFVYLLAKPDGSDPYLVFWSPVATDENNVEQNINVQRVINWTGLLNGNFKVENTSAEIFADGIASGEVFGATSGQNCNTTTLQTIRRQPAFIHLVPCTACTNVSDPGLLVVPSPNSGNAPFNAGIISNAIGATGGSGGIIEYQWQQSTDNITYNNIAGALASSYDPPALSQTTYFRRAAKRSTCSDYIYTMPVTILVGSVCPNMVSFMRFGHNMQGCNPVGDYYYELIVDQVNLNDEIMLSGLPENGVNVSMCLLNGAPMDLATFQANLHFIANNTLEWQLKSANGTTQSLRLYYCWSNAYPDPGATMALSVCSGAKLNCSPGFSEPGGEERGQVRQETGYSLSIRPNPGNAFFELEYSGNPAEKASVDILSLTGQIIDSQYFSEVPNSTAMRMDVDRLPAGLYLIRFQADGRVVWLKWEKA